MSRSDKGSFPCRDLTERIIGAAIEVHRELGPGFLEQIYENALAIELANGGMQVQRQVPLDVLFKGEQVGQHRIDLLVDKMVVLELKSVQALHNVHVAQLRSTLKAAGKEVGLLLNFNVPRMASGIKRVII